MLLKIYAFLLPEISVSIWFVYLFKSSKNYEFGTFDSSGGKKDFNLIIKFQQIEYVFEDSFHMEDFPFRL